MKNLSSYCVLTGARMRASEKKKDLPVLLALHYSKIKFSCTESKNSTNEVML